MITGLRPQQGSSFSTLMMRIDHIIPRNPANVAQINGSSHFSNDLGLDSLDTVEVVMAIEEVNT